MEWMKKVKSFTLSDFTVGLLEEMSQNSNPHVFQSAIVEAAIVDYAQKINYIVDEHELHLQNYKKYKEVKIETNEIRKKASNKKTS